MRARSTVVAAVALVLAGCGSHGSVPQEYAAVDGGEESPSTSAAPVSEDEATDKASDEVSGETYESARGAEGCTSDCSGHDAGWEWAKEHEGEDCGGNSDSFREGCEAYQEDVEARAEELQGEDPE